MSNFIYCEQDRFDMCENPDSFEMFDENSDSFQMWQGLVGPVYTPFVDESGYISWTNNGGLPNPPTRLIAGEPGRGIEISGVAASVEALPESAAQGEVWAVGESDPYYAYCWLGEWINIGRMFPQGPAGATGPYFTPAVDASGNISWTNNGGLPNPTTMNIKGGQGDPGDDGVSPEVTVTTITGGHTVSITDADHPSGQSFNVMDGQTGPTGPGVPSGGSAGQYLKKSSSTDYATEWDSLGADDVSFDGTETYAAGTVGKEISDAKAAISNVETTLKTVVATGTMSGVKSSFVNLNSASNSNITADSVVVGYEFGTPSQVLSDIDWQTTAGYVQVKGTFGSTGTTVTFYLTQKS